MKAKELEKLTLCRHCIHRERCGVWDHYYNSDDRDDIESRGIEIAVIITNCPSKEKGAKNLNKISQEGNVGNVASG